MNEAALSQMRSEPKGALVSEDESSVSYGDGLQHVQAVKRNAALQTCSGLDVDWWASGC